ncbi:MAG: hypothetical protein V5A46_00030 [Haloferacaceae archaeon]
MPTPDPGRRSDGPEELSRRLQQLKRDGCNLLVTRSSGGPAVDRTTARLFGSPRKERDRILVVVRDAAGALSAKFPPGVSIRDDRTHLIDYREAFGDGGPPTGGGDPLSRLRTDVENRLAACLSGRDPEPAEIRLGVDSLGPLLEGCPESEVSAFVTAVTTAVREARGMGHFHVDMPDERARELPLASAFDARLELRQIEARPARQRFHLPDVGTGPWMRIR